MMFSVRMIKEGRAEDPAPAAKYLKKLKDKRLKNLYEEAIKAIL